MLNRITEICVTFFSSIETFYFKNYKNLHYLRKRYIYLDPGTATILLQLLIGIAAGVLATIKIYWKKLKDLFSRSEKHKEKKTEPKQPDPKDGNSSA